jgi:uncharacterized membrane protein
MRGSVRILAVLLAAVGLLMLGVTLPASSATPSQSVSGRCTPSIIALPLPSGDTNGDVLAVTDRGRFAAGYVADNAQHQHMAVWRFANKAWTVQDLGNLGVTGTQTGLSATGVNTHHQVAIGVIAGQVGAWVFTSGKIHQIKDFAGGTFAYARAINNNGEIVGEALDADGNDFAALWPSWKSMPTRLAPVAGYDGSFAQGINDAGVVVGGSFSNGALPQVATRWSSGGNPTGLAGLGGDADAWASNTAGRTVGEASTDTSRYAVVWRGSKLIRNLGLFAGAEFSRAMDLAPNGDVVGFEGANPLPPAVPVRHVMLWPGSGPVRSLLPLSRDWSDGAYAHSMDARGDVFGASSTSHRALPRPTKWTCALEQSFVPAP